MATLTGYGGVEEIGGNAFVLEENGSRIFLDFGKRFGNDPQDNFRGANTSHMRPGEGDYFDEFLKPRSYRMALDMMALDLLPPMPEIFRPDIGGSTDTATIDGVIVSHAHADHVGLVGLLKPDIPVFMSAESRATVDSLQETGVSGVVSEFTQVRAKGYDRGSRSPISTNPARGRPLIPRNIQDATHATAGAWDVTQFTVDHSIHGARGTIVAGASISVAYTGDFRMHGRLRHETAKFLERAGGVDVLIAEGTNVHQDHKEHKDNDDEVSVEGQIEDAAAGEPGFVAIAFPPRDLDRFVSIHNVAKRLGRRLAITTKQAHLLESLRAAGRDDLPDPQTDPSLAIHLRNRGRGTLAEKRGILTITHDDGAPESIDVAVEEWDRVLATEYAAWERPYLDCNNTVSSATIGAAPRDFLFSISFWSITDVLDIFPTERPGGLYIHSMTQPFNDDMEIGDRKLERWLAAFKLRRVDTHVSGHLREEDLHHCIDEIGAKVLVPVHSLHPSVTADRYRARSGHRALLPAWGKAFEL